LISLAYRGITLWFPFAYGAIAIRWVSRTSADSTPDQRSDPSNLPAPPGPPAAATITSPGEAKTHLTP
jgi:hypothetical protein